MLNAIDYKIRLELTVGMFLETDKYLCKLFNDKECSDNYVFSNFGYDGKMKVVKMITKLKDGIRTYTVIEVDEKEC